ncbi:MAG: BolA family protein [Myxococcota bacterium]
MTRVERIESLLQNELSPVLLNVVNFSHEHNVPEGSESHIRVFAVSKEFEGLRVVKRHRLLYTLLKDELNGGLHALQLDLHASSEWNEQSETLSPPKCKGGE